MTIQPQKTKPLYRVKTKGRNIDYAGQVYYLPPGASIDDIKHSGGDREFILNYQGKKVSLGTAGAHANLLKGFKQLNIPIITPKTNEPVERTRGPSPTPTNIIYKSNKKLQRPQTMGDVYTGTELFWLNKLEQSKPDIDITDTERAKETVRRIKETIKHQEETTGIKSKITDKTDIVFDPATKSYVIFYEGKGKTGKTNTAALRQTAYQKEFNLYKQRKELLTKTYNQRKQLYDTYGYSIPFQQHLESQPKEFKHLYQQILTNDPQQTLNNLNNMKQIAYGALVPVTKAAKGFIKLTPAYQLPRSIYDSYSYHTTGKYQPYQPLLDSDVWAAGGAAAFMYAPSWLTVPAAGTFAGHATTQYLKDPSFYRLGETAALWGGIVPLVPSYKLPKLGTVTHPFRFRTKYQLKPNTAIDQFRMKEWKDYSHMVRILTDDTIPLKDITFSRITSANPKTAETLKLFHQQEKTGMGGGSTVIDSIQNVKLKRPPQDWEWYTNSPTYRSRLTTFAQQRGHKVTADGSNLYIDGVKLDINPLHLGQANIKSVSSGNWESYVITSPDGIRIIDPRILVRRSLVGAFDKGRSGKAMYRYSKDIPRLFDALEANIAHQYSQQPSGRLQATLQSYEKAVLELYLNRYKPPSSVRRLAPIKYRGYEQIQDMPKPLTKQQMAIIQAAIKRGGYLSGSSALYYQFPFRKPGDIDISFKASKDTAFQHADDIAFDLGLYPTFKSHALLHRQRLKNIMSRKYLESKEGVLYEHIPSTDGTILGKYDIAKDMITVNPNRHWISPSFNPYRFTPTWYRQRWFQKHRPDLFYDTPWKLPRYHPIEQRFIDWSFDRAKAKDLLRTLRHERAHQQAYRFDLEDEFLKAHVVSGSNRFWKKHLAEVHKSIDAGDLAHAEYLLKPQELFARYYETRRLRGIKDYIPIGRELADISVGNKADTIRVINGIPVRHWKHIIQDKRNIVRILTKREKAEGGMLPSNDAIKLVKAQQDIKLIEQGLKEGFPTKYILRNRFPYLRALSEFLPSFNKYGIYSPPPLPKLTPGKRPYFPSLPTNVPYRTPFTPVKPPYTPFVPPKSPPYMPPPRYPPIAPPYIPPPIYPPLTPPYPPPRNPPYLPPPSEPPYSPPYPPPVPPPDKPFTPYIPSIPPPTKEETPKRRKGGFAKQKEKPLAFQPITRTYTKQGPINTPLEPGTTLKDALIAGQEAVDETPASSFSIVKVRQPGRHYFPSEHRTHKFTKHHGRWYEKNKYRRDKPREQQQFVKSPISRF